MHVDIGDEGIDMTNFVPMKHVDIDQMFVETLIPELAGVVQVHRRNLRVEANNAAAESDGSEFKRRSFRLWAATKPESSPPYLLRG